MVSLSMCFRIPNDLFYYIVRVATIFVLKIFLLLLRRSQPISPFRNWTKATSSSVVYLSRKKVRQDLHV